LIGYRCYLLALSAAQRGELSVAARLAACALSLEETQDNARRLLGLCLYELGNLEAAADILAVFPDLADAVREACALTQTGLEETEQFARRGKWRAALKTADRIPHQSVRLLNIRGCILAEAGHYARAGRLFAEAMEKDTGNRFTSACLMETARRTKFFWEL
jgi:thioredoxin-like negative regulator of GroEL